MALSGSLTTNYWKDDNGKTRGYTLEWTATQSVANNQSTIKWTLKTAGTYADSVAERTLIVKLAGKTLVNKTDKVMRGSGTIKTGSFTLNHNSDGTKSMSGSIKAAVYTSSVNLTKSKDFTLNTIPRQATITSGSNGTYKNKTVSGLTIGYSNKLGSSVTSLQAGIVLQGTTPDIAYRDISKTGSSYTFSLTEAEKKVLLESVSGSNKRTITYILKTVISGVTYTSTKSATFTITPDTVSLKTFILYDNNEVTKAVTNNPYVIIQNMSNCFVEAVVEFTDYATADKFVLKCGSKSYTDTRYTNAMDCIINGIESESISVSVTDNRKNVSSFEKKCNMVPYSKPSCAIANLTKSAEGKISFKLQGIWYPNLVATDFSKENSAKLVYIINGTETEVPLDASTVEDNKYSVDVEITDLDYTQEYTLKARITDLLESSETKETVISFEPIFNWGKDYFNFNVPVTFSKGYESTSDNKVLWEGGSYMTASQTANLTENVSEQPNGIVLIFSAYTDGESKNVEFHSFFVPKYAVTKWGGSGHSFQMNTVGFGYVGAKYLYISDGYITGHDDNKKSGTGSGITYDNSRYVLRTVLGV